MQKECKLVRTLRKIQSNSDKHGAVGIRVVATCALEMVADISAHAIAPADIACLADLIVEMRREGYAGLLSHIDDDSPDCDICAALAKRLQSANTAPRQLWTAHQ